MFLWQKNVTLLQSDPTYTAFCAKILIMIKFDRRYAKYKYPFGAVQTGTEVRFFVETDREDVNITLRLWVNGAEQLIPGRREPGGFCFFYTPRQSGIVWYFFLIDSRCNRQYYSGRDGEGQLFDSQPDSYQLTVYDPFETPEWFKTTVIYQIFPDRFFRSGEITGIEEHTRLFGAPRLHRRWGEAPDYLPQDGKESYDPTDFFGGSLYGIIEKLPYLKSLGVGCIYLNPVFLSSSNHRYNTADYMRVDPMLGGDEALERLAGAAKAQGIRLMLDGVFSHTGSDSVYFQSAVSDPASPYRSWFSFDEYPDKYRCWWGFKTLPEVNELEPSYMAFIGSVLEKYAKMGITSWRLDVADELPDEFIAFLRAKLKSLDPNGVLLGEVWEEASNKHSLGGRRKYLDGHELDSVMNYPFRGLMLDFFSGRIDGGQLSSGLLNLMQNYPPQFFYSLMNLLSSHDVVRAITAFSGAPDRDALTREQQAVYQPAQGALDIGKRRFMAASAVQYMLPGAPSLYYGDEAGLTGMADPFNRGCFPWGSEDAELTAWFKRLGALRKYAAGGCALAGRGDAFALYRDGAVTVVSRSERETQVHFEESDFCGDAAALNGGRIDISLPAYGAAILTAEREERI